MSNGAERFFLKKKSSEQTLVLSCILGIVSSGALIRFHWTSQIHLFRDICANINVFVCLRVQVRVERVSVCVYVCRHFSREMLIQGKSNYLARGPSFSHLFPAGAFLRTSFPSIIYVFPPVVCFLLNLERKRRTRARYSA